MPERRRSLWVDTVFLVLVATGTQSYVDLMGSLLETETRLSRLTLVRTIIGIDIANNVHDSGEGSQQAGMGVFVISREAALAGVASLPHPNVAADFPTLPWVYRAFYRIFGFAADDPTIFTRRVDLDIRSQRKVDNGELGIVLSNDAFEGATALVSFTGIIRCLFLV
jgi:hypothetical protein